MSAGFCDLGGQLPGATAYIQNPLTAARLQQFQETRSELPNIGVLPLITLRVPGRTHTFLLRTLAFFTGLTETSDSAGGSAAPGTTEDRTSLNNSCFFRSFFDGGACSCR